MANPISSSLEKKKEKEQSEYFKEMKEKLSQKYNQNFVCEYCGDKFEKEHGLNIHIKQWCKKNPNIKRDNKLTENSKEKAKQIIDMLKGYFQFNENELMSQKGIDLLNELWEIIKGD